MQEISKSAPVMITGGTGFIAGWIIKMLLDEGFTVHATVRNPKNHTAVEHLYKLVSGSPGELQLFKADLLKEDSFKEAMESCELVIHTASPFLMSGFDDPEKELLQPARDGTRNVLNCANKTKSVKRIVLTSSVAAIYGDNRDMERTNRGCFTEDDWNISSTLHHQPYAYSKLEAEKTAWKMHKDQNRWSLVAINPSMVYGPSLTKNSASMSIMTMKKLGDGTMRFGVPQLITGMVDVRDVAQAHIVAGFKPEVRGRFILSASEISLLQISQILRDEFGNKYPFPIIEVPKLLFWLVAPLTGVSRGFVNSNVGYPLKLDNRASREHLGIDYRPERTTIIEHYRQLIRDGEL